jgi:hypothetical protein
VRELERDGSGQVRLLVGLERVVEHSRLVVVLVELGALRARLDARHLLRVVGVTALSLLRVVELVEAVGEVVDRALGDAVAALTVAVDVHDRADRAVDRQLRGGQYLDRDSLYEVAYLLPVDAKTRELGVVVREVTALEERVVREADTGHDVGCRERDLLNLRLYDL